MKFRFEAQEMDWLNTNMSRLQVLAAKTKDERLARIVSKMRYKFTPNATLCNLTQKERDVLSFLVSARLGMLAGQLSAEASTLTAIAKRLGVTQ